MPRQRAIPLAPSIGAHEHLGNRLDGGSWPSGTPRPIWSVSLVPASSPALVRAMPPSQFGCRTTRTP